MKLTTDEAQVAAHWAKTKSSANWWSHKTGQRNYSVRVCGKPLAGPAAGIQELIKSTIKTPIKKGVSVGCGLGIKEIALVKAGIVETLEGFDLSPERIEIARSKAREAGVANRALFSCVNAFERFDSPTFDLVYWDNALHHMPDVRAAIQWSRAVLKDDGVFAMDEYVGPNRFRISDDELEFVNSIRSSLPVRILAKPNGRGENYPTTITREWLARMIAKDPSEAVDAGATLPAIRDIFPGAMIRPAGGMLFFIALNGLYGGFQTDDDLALLKFLLMLDYEAVQSGRTQTLYAAALAIKGQQLENGTALAHSDVPRRDVAAHRQQLDAIKNLRSWRMLKPLRWLKHCLAKS